jgi:hypothetical protein
MNNSSVHHSPAWIGVFAAEALTSSKEGKVAGVTSSGVFLLAGRNAIFLTKRGEKSPFNIFLNEETNLSEEYSTGDRFICSSSVVNFIHTGSVIDLRDAVQWTPPVPVVMKNSIKEQSRRIRLILDELKREIPAEKGLFYLVGAKDTDEISHYVSRLQSAFSHEDLASCLDAVNGLVGYGGGLTPSGDDLLAGFLLYHVRSDMASSRERMFVRSLGESLTELAYQKTTWISANRIEAACRGWSESVFLELLDHLFDNSVELPHQLTIRLLGFGHSSGVDTLIGIAAAVGAI